MEGRELTCEICREGFNRQIDDLKDVTKEHAAEIKELSKMTIELVEMQKVLTRSQETIAETLKVLTSKVTDLEIKVAAGSKKTVPWYEVPWVASTLPWVIKAFVIAGIIVLAAAIGQNYMDAIKLINGGGK